MKDHVLANLVFDDEGFFHAFPSIAFRCLEGTCAFDANNTCLTLAGDVDFTTYLNALSIGKWHRYANVSSACLRIEMKGAACDLYATHLTPDSEQPHRSEAPLLHVKSSTTWQTIDVVLPVPAEAHIISFALVSSDDVHIRSGYWYTRVNEESLNDVRLAISTTTFRKEAYVTRNIEAIRRELFPHDGSKSNEFHLFVVDNGRTLDATALSDANVDVIPNPNVGGSGGFARGMMAASDGDYTHVLLMDDDVRVFPESFKRTRNLLRLAAGRYAHAFVEGAMLNMEDPNLLFEDVAMVKRDGMYGRIKEDLFIDTAQGIATSEATDVELPRSYGAWWYCCIPIREVREKGLPLPLFVRCDDVEYGMRCKPTIMTMNGICVWHERFEGRFKASVDSYQLTRNFLIMAACDELDPSIIKAFMMRFGRTFHIYLRSMNYNTCDLMLDALADYLKGPAFLEEVNGEDVLRENGKHNEVLVDINEIDPTIIASTVPNERYLGQGRDRGMFLKTLEMIPHDRHVLPDFLLSDKPAPMYYSRGAYPARTTMRKKTLVAYDQSATMAHVRTMDRDRWHRLRERYSVLMHEYRKRKDEVAQDYREAMPRLTSRDFWEEYLQKRS